MLTGRHYISAAVADAVGVLATFALLAYSRALANVVLVLLAAWALAGPRRAMQALALAVFVRYSNPALVDLGVESGPLLWLVLLVAGLRVLPLLCAADARRLVFVWTFAGLATVLAPFNSPAPAVSILKAVTFAWVVSTLFVALRAVARDELGRLVHWFAMLGTITLLLSAATLLDPAVAFQHNGTGLQGILIHPQTLAIVAAPLAAFGLVAVVLRRRTGHPVLIALVALAWILLALTEARTGMLAAVVGTVAGLAMHLWRSNPDGRFASRTRLVVLGATASIALVSYVATTDLLAREVETFLLKRSGETSLGQAFYASRGAAVVGQWHNFLERPVTGNGFGVYAGPADSTDVVEFAGIPISAPVEKGFLPTAVLEETGLLGGVLFLLMIVQLLRLAWRSGDPRGFAVVVASIATNAGEASMLSPGAPGLLLWCFIALAVEAGRLRVGDTDRRRPVTGPLAAPIRFPQVMR
jgi:hypothetical protein